MNEKHIKDAKLITSIFNTFKEGSAIIAGGYPRDLQLGREPRDIDILVEWESKLDYDELTILADSLGYSCRDYSNRYSDDIGGQLRRVVSLIPKLERGQFEENVVIDVIFLNCPVFERIDNFPSNLSKVWLVENTVIESGHFTDGKRCKVLKFSGDCPEEYITRMRSYFPDYRVEYAD